MEFIGPSVPNNTLLEAVAPMLMWDIAKSQAERSPMIRFRVGACIWDPSHDKPIGKGCSHPDVAYSRMSTSIHAEHHALRGCNHLDLAGYWVCLFTLNGRGGCSWSSRPCFSCARSLYRAGIERVIYPEWKGSWTIREEHPEELLARAPKPTGPFARQQRIPT